MLATLLSILLEEPLLAQRCVVCQQGLTGTFYWLSNPELPQRVAVCASCSKIETVCSTCKLPVKKSFLKLEDGRFLCSEHARNAVLTLEQANAILAETKREMIRLLRGCGTTPDRNLSLEVVDAPQMKLLCDELKKPETVGNPQGLTRSRRAGPDYSHQVYLLSGLAPKRAMATLAHEYTHAWMAENVPTDRRLQNDAIEGFCELAAYRLMSDLGQQAEMRLILTNAYTRGQINTFVKAEDNLRFYRIVEWIKAGVEDHIDTDNTASVLALKSPPPASPALSAAPATQVPDRLMLKGVSGRPGRWLALINDRTFQSGETARVRVGTTNFLVHCVSTEARSAVIELVETGARHELRIGE